MSNGTLGASFINSIIADVPDMIRHIGIPVSKDWVHSNLCEGSSQYPGLEHVTEADVKKYEKYSEMLGPYKTKVPAATIMTRGFVNLTEYVGKKDPFRDVPHDRTPCYAVVINIDGVEEWLNNQREKYALGSNQFVDPGEGEAFLDQLFEQHKDCETNMEEFLIAKNATIFGTLAAKEASTAMVIA